MSMPSTNNQEFDYVHRRPGFTWTDTRRGQLAIAVLSSSLPRSRFHAI
jgi:hypothetical protein